MLQRQRILDLKIDELSENLGITVEILVSAIGVSARSVERWRTGDSFPQHDARERIERLRALKVQLYDTFATADAVHAWMRTNNRYLSGLSPIEVLRAGRIDRIEAALEVLASGIFI